MRLEFTVGLEDERIILACQTVPNPRTPSQSLEIFIRQTVEVLRLLEEEMTCPDPVPDPD